MESIFIEIDNEFFETTGEASLVGHIVDKVGNILPSTVNLVFKQSSFNFKKKNNGPNTWIIPEHAPMCLLLDILWLQSQGVSIVVNEKIDERYWHE